MKLFQSQKPQGEPVQMGFPPARPWYEREVSTFQPDDFFRIIELVSGTLGVDHEFVHFESDFVRDLGATEERREAVLRVIELAYDTTFPEAIRASITTPISAYIALARVGKIDDEEAKQQTIEDKNAMINDAEVDLEKIKNALDEVCNQLTITHHCEKRWTHDVLQSIAKVAPKGVFRCSSCFNKEKHPNSYAEWLYDMTWYTEDDKNRLTKIVLVLESEWLADEYEMKYDFEKLLQAKCQKKVFICQSELAKEMAQNGIEAYAKENKEFLNENERYLIAIYEDSKEKGKGHFNYHVFTGTGKEIKGEENEEVQ